MSGEDAYAKAGVSQSDADLAVSRLVAALATANIGRPTRQVDLKGHYAAVMRLDNRTGIALSTDGVGTKLLVAEELGRFDTVGIDCIAMNVNDIICVGAEPVAMLDYLAVEKADPEMCEQIGVGLARGAELAGIEIPGGELAQIGDLVKGFDIAGACFGTVALDSIIDGSAVAPTNVVIGLPSSGIHSNGYTLARSALDGIGMDDNRLGRPLGEVLLEPTEIYVKAVLDLLAPKRGEVVLDLYSGVRQKARFLADAVGPTGRVLSVEGDRTASRHARTNLAGLPGVVVEQGPVDRVLASPLPSAFAQVDLVVLDPPREG
ncbi:MAG TPA: phosphoribosylformylglycinamidine cyclo-ligase, partial [Solirubrobacterales bacterium]|nr:phosphoribosylformylglycinamidine cyclo-ligase [Solirubrobacterales bacterium]